MNFKILTDSTLNDIEPVEFAALKKSTKTVEGDFGKPCMLPFKSNADWVWGDTDVSSIGCTVTAEMIKTNNNR